MNKKLIVLSVLLLSLALVLAGCTTADTNTEENSDEELANSSQDVGEELKTAKSQYPMTITDDFDNETELQAAPQKIISLSPTMTEIIFALGAGDRLVGRTDYSDYPAEVNNIQSIGTLREPSFEKITELQPDLILASEMTNADGINKLEQLEFDIISFKAEKDFEGIYQQILEVGKILNKNEAAQTLVEEMKEDVVYVKEKVDGVEKKDVYYVVGYGEFGDYTAGGDTFISDLIEIAGGNNVAKDVNGWNYSVEQLVEKDPDLLICSDKYNSKEGIQEANGYKDLRAVKEGNLYELNENLIHRSGPRVTQGLIELAKIIHPEQFEE